MKKIQYLVGFLLILACVGAIMYSYYFYCDYVVFHADYPDPNERLKMSQFMGLSYTMMKVSVSGIFLILAISERLFKKTNNLLLGNLILILPVLIFWLSKYIAVPILFSQCMSIVETVKLYLNGNLIYLLVSICKKIIGHQKASNA